MSLFELTKKLNYTYHSINTICCTEQPENLTVNQSRLSISYDSLPFAIAETAESG